MKANKPLKEAILRAPESTDQHKQPQQEQLYHMGTAGKQTADTTQDQSGLVNQSHTNRMATFQNLREMEYTVAKKIGKPKK